jgi:hypothetical protein
MDPVELAAMSSPSRTVWSTRPTRTQRPFPPKIAGLVEQYLQNQAGWIRAVDSHALTAPEIKDNPRWTQQLGDLLGHHSQRISTVLLTAEYVDAIDFDLTAYDDGGNQIAHASDSLEGSYPTDSEVLQALFPNSGEKPISLEGDDRLFFDYVHKATVDKRGPPPPELLAKLLDPDHFDPLRLSVSPVLVQVAKVRGVNMIARLPDTAFRVGNLFQGGKSDGARVFKNLRFGGCRLEFNRGWITIKPDRPATSQVSQADRISLAKFMQRSNSDKPLTIDEQSQFRAPLPEHQANNLPWSIAVFLDRQETRFLDTPILRFYGEATTQQKERMLADGMPFSSLTTREHEILDRQVYGPRGFQLIFRPIAGNDGSPPVDTELYSSGILSEPTEALPNGLPADGIVMMHVENASCVFLESSASNVRGGTEIVINRLVMLKYAQNHPEEYGQGSPMMSMDLNHFIVGKQTQITFTFQFTPTLSMTGTLLDGNVTDLKPATFDELPKDFKAEFDESYKSWAKMMSMRGVGTSKAVPPP